MGTVQNVIFDLGGVLLDWNPSGILERCYADTLSQDAMRDAFGVLLRRAQQAGAVRADVTTQDLTALLKGLLRTINDLPPGTGDEGRTDRLLTVVTDGLRRRDDQASGGARAQARPSP